MVKICNSLFYSLMFSDLFRTFKKCSYSVYVTKQSLVLYIQVMGFHLDNLSAKWITTKKDESLEFYSLSVAFSLEDYSFLNICFWGSIYPVFLSFSFETSRPIITWKLTLSLLASTLLSFGHWLLILGRLWRSSIVSLKCIITSVTAGVEEKLNHSY